MEDFAPRYQPQDHHGNEIVRARLSHDVPTVAPGKTDADHQLWFDTDTVAFLDGDTKKRVALEQDPQPISIVYNANEDVDTITMGVSGEVISMGYNADGDVADITTSSHVLDIGYDAVGNVATIVPTPA